MQGLGFGLSAVVQDPFLELQETTDDWCKSLGWGSTCVLHLYSRWTSAKRGLVVKSRPVLRHLAVMPAGPKTSKPICSCYLPDAEPSALSISKPVQASTKSKCELKRGILECRSLDGDFRR